MLTKDELYLIADELRAVASVGLQFAEHGYDKERYERVLRASARLVSVVEGSLPEEIYAQYSGNMAHMSPVMCVEAVVMRGGQVLLIQRSDDHLWALPGGVAEIGESPAHAAERELWEEAGVRARADKLLGIFDSRHWPSRSRFQLYIATFLMETEDTPALHAPETLEFASGLSSFAEALDVKFFSEGQLPPLSPGHDSRVPFAFRLVRGDEILPFFDRSDEDA
jgi:ADP-ribose pyrophosphatase YjhB (NUDIX family)